MVDECGSGEMDCVIWIDGRDNLADSLTKFSSEITNKINNMLARGIWDVILDEKWRI